MPFTAFSGPKRPKKGTYLGGVRSGNGPTSAGGGVAGNPDLEICALYGVFRPKTAQKRYTYLGGRRAGGGSGPGTARPKKYVPFTAFSGPKRPKKGTYLGGRRAGGVRYVPLPVFSCLKQPQKGTYLGGRRAGGGGGPVRERPDLRNTCPLRRFQAQKDPKKVRIWEVGGQGGVRSGNGPT